MVTRLHPIWILLTVAAAGPAATPLIGLADLDAQSAAAADPAPPRPVGSAVVGGTLGSVVGAVVGFGMGAVVDLGLGICDADDLSSDEKFCTAFPAVVVGTIVGSALGARIGARRGGAAPSLKATLVAATAGVLTGTLGSLAVGAMTDNGQLRLVGFSVGQGTLAGLVAALRCSGAECKRLRVTVR